MNIIRAPSPDTAQAIQEVLASHRRDVTQPGKQRPGGGSNVQLVRITSVAEEDLEETEGGDALYPGKLLLWTSSGSWEDGEDCWALELNGQEPPDDDEVHYPGKLLGRFSDGLAVFSIGGSCGLAQVVTDVTCVAGVFTVTKRVLICGSVPDLIIDEGEGWT